MQLASVRDFEIGKKEIKQEIKWQDFASFWLNELDLFHRLALKGMVSVSITEKVHNALNLFHSMPSGNVANERKRDAVRLNGINELQ